MFDQFVPEIEARLKAVIKELAQAAGVQKQDFEQVGIVIRPKYERDPEGKIIGVGLCYEGIAGDKLVREITLLEVLEKEI